MSAEWWILQYLILFTCGSLFGRAGIVGSVIGTVVYLIFFK